MVNLKDKLELAIKEVGHLPLICEQSTCLEKQYHNMKSTHCAELIPHVKRIEYRIYVIDLCAKKVESYYK